MRKKLKRIAIGLVILVIVVSAGVLTTLWVLGGGKPNIAVDYVAIFNENAAAVPEEDRAWQLYLELVPDLVEFSDWGYRSQLKDIEPGSERWTNLISLVEKKVSPASQGMLSLSGPFLTITTRPISSVSPVMTR